LILWPHARLPRWLSVGPFSALLLILVVGAVTWGSTSINARSPNPIAPLDYFMDNPSFSEIQVAEAQVRASALRLITEFRGQRSVLFAAAGLTPDYYGELRREELELRNTLARLSSTEGQGTLVKELLFILKQMGDAESWLAVYLDSLYRAPAWTLTGQLAIEALRIGQETGKERAVRAALEHVLEIPLDLEVKHQVLHALQQTQAPGVSSEK
jgi:hypothetical protein